MLASLSDQQCLNETAAPVAEVDGGAPITIYPIPGRWSSEYKTNLSQHKKPGE